MLRGLLGLVSAATGVLFVCPALAEPPASIDLGPHERRCDSHFAREVEAQALIAHPERFQGQCVSVIAYRRGSTLHAERWSAERSFRHKALWDGGGQIGLYPPDGDRARPDLIVLSRVVGVVSDCVCFQGTQVMVTGYCHYYEKGPVVLAASASGIE